MVGTVGAEYALKLDQGEPVAESLQRLTYGVGEKGALMGFVMTCQPFNWCLRKAVCDRAR